MLSFLGIEAEVLFDLWLISLTVIFASFVVLVGLYFKSRGTPLGKNALYFAISALLWSIASAVYSAPYVVGFQFSSDFVFLGLTAMAGIASIIGAYERAIIQVVLTRSDERQPKSRFISVLAVLPLFVALFMAVNLATGNSFLPHIIGETSLLTVFSLILVSVSLLALFNSRFPKKLIFVGSGLTFGLAVATLVSYFLNNIPVETFLLGTGSIATAKALIITSLALFLATRGGLKAWIIKITLSIGVLFMVVLAFIGLIVHHPGFFSIPIAVFFLLVGTSLFYRSWSLHTYKVPQLIVL